ncbi:unnamed protein product [Allacma fusca]|uniref:Uncharacterized protein n=1 Tax=Allacma fusca TaxID=39272 RepID=A0A8J2J9B2_9HEXA|nr:unnamed protein product [Allacma fusca]
MILTPWNSNLNLVAGSTLGNYFRIWSRSRGKANWSYSCSHHRALSNELTSPWAGALGGSGVSILTPRTTVGTNLPIDMSPGVKYSGVGSNMLCWRNRKGWPVVHTCFPTTCGDSRKQSQTL